MGVDVGAAGGVYAATKGLYERFGEERVIDSPITEAGLLGAAVGAAMAVSRQPVRTRFAWQVGAVAIVAAVALDRWVTSAHWVSDIVGGVLYGSLVATVSLISAVSTMSKSFGCPSSSTRRSRISSTIARVRAALE